MVPSSRYLIYPITWYSVLILSGALLAILVASRLADREKLPQDTVTDLALRMIPFGILGARAYYVFFSWSSFRDDPLSVFRVWEGGLAVYGGILAGLLVIYVYCRRRRLSVLSVCDVIVPGLALAQAIGRWGNFFNMEAYGWTVRNPALCFFPFAVLIPARGGSVWHLATFFYESCWDLSVFVLLMILRRKFLLQKGDLLRFYVLLYGAARLVIEELREDSLYTGGIRISQLLSILAVLFLVLRLLFRAAGARNAVSLRKAVWPFAGCFALSSVLTVCYALKLPWFRFLSFPRNLLLLLSFSILSVSLSFFLFFSTQLDRRSKCQQQN